MKNKTQITPNPAAATATATVRRSKNGVLVAVAVLAAIGITLILNYVVYWQYRGMSPDARQWVRYDLTSTRRYSLSPQSRGVLEGVTDRHRLVSMLGGGSLTPEQRQRVRDLVEEYARANKQIEALHIDLESETDRRDALLSEMDAMFAEDTAPVRAAIIDGLSKLERYEEIVDKIEAGLKRIVDSDVQMRPASIQRQRLVDLHSQYLRLQDLAKRVRELRDAELGKDWKARLKSPGGIEAESYNQGESLPDYTDLLVAIRQYVIQFAGQTLPDTPNKADQVRRSIVVDRLTKPETQQAALEAQNTLAALVQQVPTLQRQIKTETDPLLSVAPPLRYEDARDVLNDKPCVLLTSGDKARVLPAEMLFRGAGGIEGGQTNDLFVGEEQLTGAFISIGLKQPPLIVFVRSNTGRRALSIAGKEGQRIEGDFDHVAKRLLAMDFEVVEWADPVNQDPPTPKAGQKVVWFTLPYLKPDTRIRESLDSTRKDNVASHLEARLKMGDSALVMLGYNPDTDPRLATDRPADTLVTVLDGYGIDPQLYLSITRLSEEAEDASQSKYSPRFLVDQWPDSALVGEALNGIATFFYAPMPIELRKTQGVEHTPLVELAFSEMYVQRTVPDAETGRFTPEPDSGRDSVLIGVAAEKDDTRLVTIADATWAMDNFTSLAVLPDGTTGPGLADQPGARFAYPGNSDLFVNCICWLAGLDELIAASPRTQDVRRISAMSDESVRAYRVVLWGGMPALIFAIGIGVWLIRRRA